MNKEVLEKYLLSEKIPGYGQGTQDHCVVGSVVGTGDGKYKHIYLT